MNTAPPTALPFADRVPADVMADLEAIITAIHTGTEVDPVIRDRVRAAAERNREEIFRRHGLLDIAVPAIRELRGELPNS